jgi:hypothetical protein
MGSPPSIFNDAINWNRKSAQPQLQNMKWEESGNPVNTF